MLYINGGAVVEALHYKPQGYEFDSRMCLWCFPLTSSFWPHCGLWFDSVSKSNECQEYFLVVKVAGA
jgi:hypothetical protein